MSNLLNEKCALAKLRAELEGRKGKLCWYCRKFGHLAHNYRSKKKGEKGVAMPQNKFKIWSSRVMQCGIEERMIRSVRVAVVKCFKCGKEVSWLSKIAKSLFIFLFFYLGLTTQKGVWESVTSQEVTMSHDRCGKVVHRPCSSCISSVENLMRTLSSFLCQSLNKEQLVLFRLGV